MVFSYNWLQSFFNSKLPKPEEVAELLTMASFQVENVVKKGKDWILDIDILPNRAGDCLSHWGVAREVGAITNLKLKTKKEKPNLKTKKFFSDSFIKVEVKNENDCPRYTAMVVANVKVGESPKWIQEYLAVCGLRPINNIVDITNFVMLETGQPLHAFDFDKISGKKIIVRRARKGEKIVSLDNQELVLDENILVIADIEKPLAIAGIKGGKRAEITAQTKAIILEAANFNKTLIRLASRQAGLRTDASIRFERGLDQNLTETAIKRAAFLIQQTVTGQAVAGSIVDVYPKKVLMKKIIFNVQRANRLLGANISAREMADIFKRLGFAVSALRGKIQVMAPTFRLDIQNANDLAEEVGRIYGYDKIPQVFPQMAIAPPGKNLALFWIEMARDILKGLGFSELYNYSFISQEEAALFNYNPAALAELQNPISAKQQYLRPTLIINILKNLKDNLRWFGQINTFELGKTFVAKKSGQITERKMLTGLMAGAQLKSKEAFYQAKGAVDGLLAGLGLTGVWYDAYQPTPERTKAGLWHMGRAAEIKVGDIEIGFLGEIAPRILSQLKISAKLAVFDLDMEKLVQLSSEEHEYRPLSVFPSASRDLAVLVPCMVKVEDVCNIIEPAGGGLLRDTDLFDIYEGEELSGGKKNLAFHLVFQAQDRTLTAGEIDELMNKIIAALENEPEWEVRR